MEQKTAVKKRLIYIYGAKRTLDRPRQGSPDDALWGTPRADTAGPSSHKPSNMPLSVFHVFLCFVFRDSGGVCVSCFEISGGSVFRVSLPERLCFIFVGVIDERWGEESSLLVERTGE